MNVRYKFIDNQVLKLYQKLEKISFPMNMMDVINQIPNCRYMSYQKFAEVSNCSINDVINLCESTSGCTHYDIVNDRYLILCNQSPENNNNLGRQRWTCGHEVGHIICKHHTLSTYEKIAENSLLKTADPFYEVEADYFSATLLAPFPLFGILNVNSSMDIQNTFGLSDEASFYRYKEFIRWQKHRCKTAWENDIIKIYRQKTSVF